MKRRRRNDSSNNSGGLHKPTAITGKTQRSEDKLALKEVNPSTKQTREWWICTEDAVTAACVVLCYGKTRNWDYVWDDEIIYQHEPAMTQNTPYDLWFRPMEKEIHYWPVTYTSFWIEYQFVGQTFRPDLSHVINMLLHFGNCCLLYRILLRLILREYAKWSTWIFAVHPVHVESVAWIIERKDVLSGFFYLASIVLHPNTIEEDEDSVKKNKKRQHGHLWTRTWFLSLVCYILALWSKSIAVSLPMTLLLIPWIQNSGRLTISQFQRTLPFFVIGILLTIYDVHMAWGREPVNFGYSMLQRLGIATKCLCFYIQKIIWPYPLVMVYPRWVIPMHPITIITHIGIVAMVGIWCFYVVGIKQSPFQSKLMDRGILATFLFFGWTLFPVLGLLDYGYMRYSFVADRYQYLASIGPITLLVVAGLGQCQNKRVGNMLGAVTLIVLMALTWQQVDHYQNNETFFRQVIRYNPNASIGYQILGNEFLRQNRLTEAIPMYEQALAVEPEKEVDVLLNYGITLNRLGRNEESIAMLERLLQMEHDTSNAKVWNALGNAHSDLQQRDDAIRYFQRSLDENPTYVASWYNLGNEYLRSGRLEEATDAYKRTVELDPKHVKAYINMASALIASQKVQRATDLLEHALELHPQNRLVIDKLQEARSLLQNP